MTIIMNNKSILVDIDETTNSIMSSIKSDISDEICLGIMTLIGEASDKVSNSISNVENNLTAAVRNTDRLTEKCNKTLMEIQDEVEDISDSLASLDGLEKISNCATVLSDTVGNLNSTLADLAKSVNDSRREILKQVSSHTDDIRHEMSKKTDGLIRKIDELSLSVSQKIDTGLAQLNANRENDNRILLQRVDNLDNRIKALDVKVGDLISGIASTMADRHKELSDMISQVSAEITNHNKKSEIAYNDNLSLLNKILYVVTPFWKRNKTQQ